MHLIAQEPPCLSKLISIRLAVNLRLIYQYVESDFLLSDCQNLLIHENWERPLLHLCLNEGSSAKLSNTSMLGMVNDPVSIERFSNHEVDQIH